MLLQRCICHPLRRQHRIAQQALLTQIRLANTAASSSTTFENKLVQLAQQRLKQASTAAAGSSTGYGADVEAAKRVKQLEGLRDALKEFQKSNELCASLQDVVDNDPDSDMRELARIDLDETQESLSKTMNALQTALIPPSSAEELGCLVEIKSGVGGGEASIFAADLLRMYSRFADAKGWKGEVVNAASVSAGPGDTEAYREVTLDIDSEGAYALLKHEAGVHRVQRVPATESQGRVHTSTASVIVLPSASGNNATLDSVLDEKDVKVEVMRSGGAGGQHVNRTESAVRLTHLPTGITVSMQDTRSQHKNRAKAFQILRSRLLALQLTEQQAADRSARRLQVRTQDRSEKIRTYNYAQDRITDHRLPLTLNGIEGYLDGDDGKLEYMSDQVNQWAVRQQLDELLDAELS